MELVCDRDGRVYDVSSTLVSIQGCQKCLAVLTLFSIKKLPDDFDLKIGALVEPIAVAWHAVATSPYKGRYRAYSSMWGTQA